MFKVYPKNLVFIVTHRCNAHCVMCNIWQDGKKDELSLAEIKKIFNQKLFSRLEVVTFSGGEASLRPDLEDIIKYFLNSKKRLKNITIATNSLASQLVYQKTERILKYISKNNLKTNLTVQISCDGVGEAADKVRGTPGAFQKIDSLINQLNILKQKYSNLMIKTATLVLPQNIEELDRVMEYAKKKNVNYQFTHLFISSEYYQNDSNKDNLVLSKEQTQKIINFLERYDAKGFANRYYANLVKNMYRGQSRGGDCGFLTPKNIFIEATGNVHFCMNSQEYKLGNISLSSEKNFWQGKKYHKLRKDVLGNCCRRCKNNCGFSPKGFAVSYFRNFFKINRNF